MSGSASLDTTSPFIAPGGRRAAANDGERRLPIPLAPAEGWLTLVLVIEARRRSILYQRASAGVVVSFVKKVRLRFASEIQELVSAIGKTLEIVGPEDSSGAVTQEIDKADSIDFRDGRRTRNNDWITPAIAALIHRF